MLPNLLVDTTVLPPAERFDFWYALVARETAPAHITSAHLDNFVGYARAIDLGRIRLTSLRYPSLDSTRPSQLVRRAEADVYQLALPASVLIAYAFAAGGLAVTTYLRDFPDFQYIQLVMLPMYLFATTFYPLSVYPAAVQPLIRALPLYHSIELVREPALGHLGWDLLIPVVYLVAFGSIAMYVATRRMTRAMLR
ncbi:ABC transporter permease [Micromonospora sp. WMMD710]|uniref:ABC transporter permease n=1 Tax=Micromonospora sp. WMMD710 TaxID=3016085 RepID=UPI002416B7B3|nr:ABC transporter permease [Micromonospora sp. WMMD710]MDG4758045.1 ABC transporter permease [Micromonospora sp. WMMD710]